MPPQQPFRFRPARASQFTPVDDRVWWKGDRQLLLSQIVKAAIANSRRSTHFGGMEWSKIAPSFHNDGSLRDIYIRETTLNDWTCVWNFLRSGSEHLTFEVDGVAITPPLRVEDVFRQGALHSLNASFSYGKQRINCHFFAIEEIEFDLDPRDIDGAVEAESLATFLTALGRATLKQVLLTAENEPDTIIARYDPTSGNIIWTPMTV